jgi:hypothetical protein
MQRAIAAILAIPTVLNGLAMLVAGPFWYANGPGASGTGPFNPHFVQDIGMAFLVTGLALAARAWRPRYWSAAVAGAGFLAAHALIHLVAIVGGHDHQAGFDLVAVVLPAVVALKNAGHELRIEPAMINGAVGALLYLDGELDHTLSMAIDGERIVAIYIVRNPDKLRHLPSASRHH